MTFRTRFAPSPTGPLHLGHAYSALFAAEMAARHDGEFLLRIEDIDHTRCRAEYETQIYEDLHWLGLDWPRPVLRQSDRLDEYHAMLDRLWDEGLIYPCYCTRREIEDAIRAALPEGETPPYGPDGPIYPGTCKLRPRPSRRPRNQTLRLDVSRAVNWVDMNGATFTELSADGDDPQGKLTRRKFGVAFILAQETMGDVVIARRDLGTSYHLSVILDDADQKITHVIRGRDLFDATWIHVLLQHVIGLKTPIYMHHKLIRDEAGKRLAKRDDARAIAKYRADGLNVSELRQMIGLPISGGEAL